MNPAADPDPVAPAPATRRRVLAWINVVLMTLFLLAFLVGINLVSHARFARIDMTMDQVWEISPQSRQLIRSLQRPISVFPNFSAGPEVQDKSLPMAWTRTANLLTEFQSLNSKLTIRPLRENAPDFMDLLKQISRPEYNTIYFLTRDVEDKPVVQSIGVRELYEGNPSTGEILDYIGEAKIVTLIAQLASDRKTKIYFTEGHREIKPSQSDGKGLAVVASRVISLENSEFKPLDLARDRAVPDDADLVFIVEPVTDFTTSETEALAKYWARGGRVFVAINPLIADPLVELKRCLETFGARFNRDIIIDAQKENGNPGVLTVRRFMQHPVNQGMYETMYRVAFSSTVDPVLSSRRQQAKVLFSSSPDTWAETDLPPKSDSKHNPGERVGNLPLAVVAEEDTGAGKPARLVAWGGSAALKNEMNLTGAAANEQTVGFILNNFRWLLEREMLIAPPAESRKPRMKPFQPGPSGLSTMRWITIGGIPFVGIALGMLAWYVRRK